MGPYTHCPNCDMKIPLWISVWRRRPTPAIIRCGYCNWFKWWINW